MKRVSSIQAEQIDRIGTQKMMVITERRMLQRENEIIAGFRAGDLRAYEQVYALNAPRVYRFAYHLLGNREEAEDIRQETFVRAFQAFHRFRNDASLQTWLLKICANLCRDKIKSWDRRNVKYNSAEVPDEKGENTVSQDPAEQLNTKETNRIIMSTLETMPVSHREVIVMREFEELSYEQMATILSCSAASAKLRVFRARKCLRERVTSLLELN